MVERAVISLEDVGPGAPYDTEENLQKLRIIADFLKGENAPFGINLIPRFLNPLIGYDRAVNQTSDPFIQSFNSTLTYMKSQGGWLNVNGYTHQFGNAVSGVGYEFFSLACTSNCPPDDSLNACNQAFEFDESYAFGRMELAFDTVTQASLTASGFVTPRTSSSDSQRCIRGAWAGVFVENDPQNLSKRTLTIQDTDNPFYRGVVYVPTPLGTVDPSNPQGDVTRICQAVLTFGDQDLASFTYPPFLEFPFIQITGSGVIYDNNSYLKQIVSCIKNAGFTFSRLSDLINFAPCSRQTFFFQGESNRVYAADALGDGNTDLIIWQPDLGNWHLVLVDLPPSGARQGAFISPNTALTNWARGTFWVPLFGDVTGNGKAGIIVWNPQGGSWQVALSTGGMFVPSPGPGDGIWLQPWAVGDFWVPFVGDFNGDGKDDIMVWNPQGGTWQVALSTGNQFVPSPGAAGTSLWLNSWAVGTFWVPVVGDFNGDGKDDIAVLNPSSGTWQVALSTGSQFVPSPGAAGNFVWLDGFGAGGSFKPLVGDFNGDGKDDLYIVNVTQGDWQVALSTGNQFTKLGGSFGPWAAGSQMQPLVGDFDGDGKDDICARNPTLRFGTIDFAVSMSGK